MVLHLALLLAAVVAAVAGSVRLSNLELPHDATGKPLVSGEADVLVLQRPGDSTPTYYLYANDWGGCAGIDCCDSPGGCMSCCWRTANYSGTADGCVDTYNHSIRLYSTQDMDSWKDHGTVWAAQTGVVYRPHVLHNPHAEDPGRRFVMWARAGRVPVHSYVVLTAPAPEGPWHVFNKAATLPSLGHCTDPSTLCYLQSDHDLFVDPADGAGYIARNGMILRLRGDFLAADLRIGPVPVPTPSFGETPCVFTRAGRYYMLSGYHCCACKGGSNLWVNVADHPLGPWKFLGDIGLNTSCTSPLIPPTTNSIPLTHSPHSFITRSQAATVFEVNGSLVLLGNQWVSSARRNTDLFFWSELQFDPATGHPTQIEWHDEMVLPSVVGSMRSYRAKTDDDSSKHVQSAGRTFYVDSHDGDDNRTGSSAAAAWRSLHRVNKEALRGGDSVLFRRGCVWRGASLHGQSGDVENGHVRFGAWGDASAPKPQLLGSVSAAAPSDWTAIRDGVWRANLTELWARAGGQIAQITDVGNIVLRGGTPAANLTAARKVWAASELARPADFYYNFSFREIPDDAGSLLVLSPHGNPATVFGGFVEVAVMTRSHAVVTNAGVSFAIYEDLDIRYAGGDGMYGGSVSNFIVRRCDLSWIGGGCLESGPRWKNPLECTRFGNGIEFPDFQESGAFHAHTQNIELYQNRLWEVYDAALSPQGAGTYIQSNITYHHNLIWHSEYCLEIWSQGFANESTLTDVRFENNVCVDSGGGWSHGVRPDPSGRHICSFQTSGNVSDIIIRNNVFWQSVPFQAGWWMSDAWGHQPCDHGTCGWQGDFLTQNNIWFQTDPSLGLMISMGHTQNDTHAFSYSAAGLHAFQKLTGLSGHGALLADPLLLGLLPPHRGRSNMTPETSLQPGAGSPAIGSGVWTGVATDFAGTLIPLVHPDIGAFQSHRGLKTDEGCPFPPNTRGPTIMAPMNFNGRAEWTSNFTNMMLDLHYQPFGLNGNDTSMGAADYYNSTFADASSFTRLKGGSNLLRVGVVFWGLYGCNEYGYAHVLCKNWRQRWQLVYEYMQPWIANRTFSGIYFGDELMGQGMPLSNITAAVNFVRATWPTAILAYNEDFNVIASGYTGLNESVSADPHWTLPAGLDFFSVDYYCAFHRCQPHRCSTQPLPISSYDPQCAVHLRHAYENVVYPRLAPRTKALLVPGAFAPFPGASSAPCPAWSAGPECPNPLNASVATYDAFWAKHASQLWEWAVGDSMIAGFSPWHFDEEPSYPPQMVRGFRDMPETLSMWTEIGTKVLENARHAARADLP